VLLSGPLYSLNNVEGRRFVPDFHMKTTVNPARSGNSAR
jgi:hypothetical protein